MKNILEASLSTVTSIVAVIGVLSPTAALAFRPSPDQILYSYSLPDGTPVCVVMNHANTRSVPDGKGGWKFIPDPQPIALDCRNGNLIAEEHVPVPRPEPTPTPAPAPEPAPEPEPSEEEIKRETCRQIMDGATEGAHEAFGPGIAVMEAQMIAALSCAIFL